MGGNTPVSSISKKSKSRAALGDGFHSEREGGLIKDDITRDDDPVAGKVKAPVPFVKGGISRKTHKVDRGASLCVAVAERFG
jgi:hypothetical protein